MYVIGVSAQRFDRLARLAVPYHHCRILAARGQFLAVRAENDGGDRCRVPGQCSRLPAGFYVPQFDGAVFAGRRQGLAVRAECHRIHPVRVPRQGANGAACCHLPNPHRGVAAPRCQQFPVRAERDAIHRARVSAQCSEEPPLFRIRIPESNGVIQTPRSQNQPDAREGDRKHSARMSLQRLRQCKLRNNGGRFRRYSLRFRDKRRIYFRYLLRPRLLFFWWLTRAWLGLSRRRWTFSLSGRHLRSALPNPHDQQDHE